MVYFLTIFDGLIGIIIIKINPRHPEGITTSYNLRIHLK